MIGVFSDWQIDIQLQSDHVRLGSTALIPYQCNIQVFYRELPQASSINNDIPKIKLQKKKLIKVANGHKLHVI